MIAAVTVSFPRLAVTTWTRLLVAAAIGLATGAFTWVLQNLPLDAVNNSGAVWAVVAWAVSARLRLTGIRAAAAGTLVLLGADVGYYATTTLVLNDDVNALTMRAPIFWALVALVAGPVMGLAGAAWRSGWGLGAAAGVLLAEALYLTVALNGYLRAAVLVALAAVLLASVPRDARHRRAALLATGGWTVAAALGYAVLWLLTI